MNPKHIKRVFIDMDGVLSDFVGGVKKLFDVDEIDWSISSDIIQHFQIPPKVFWKACDYNFWRNLEKTFFADALVSFLGKTFGYDKMCIVSKPCMSMGCMDGKRDWLQHHYPMIKKHLFGNAREYLASCDAILIDDFEKNCNKFRDNGGLACLVKRPWNTKGVFYTLESIKSDMENASRCL